jgi:hypothetical protein
VRHDNEATRVVVQRRRCVLELSLLLWLRRSLLHRRLRWRLLLTHCCL